MCCPSSPWRWVLGLPVPALCGLEKQSLSCRRLLFFLVGAMETAGAAFVAMLMDRLHALEEESHQLRATLSKLQQAPAVPPVYLLPHTGFLDYSNGFAFSWKPLEAPEMYDDRPLFAERKPFGRRLQGSCHFSVRRLASAPRRMPPIHRQSRGGSKSSTAGRCGRRHFPAQAMDGLQWVPLHSGQLHFMASPGQRLLKAPALTAPAPRRR